MPNLPSTNIGTGSSSPAAGWGTPPVIGGNASANKLLSAFSQMFGANSPILAALAGWLQTAEAEQALAQRDSQSATNSLSDTLSNRGELEVSSGRDMASLFRGASQDRVGAGQEARRSFETGRDRSAQMLGSSPMARANDYARSAVLEHALSGNTMGSFNFGGMNHPDAGVNKYAASWKPTPIPGAAKEVNQGARDRAKFEWEGTRQDYNPGGAYAPSGNAALDQALSGVRSKAAERDSAYGSSLQDYIDTGASSAQQELARGYSSARPYYDQATEAAKKQQEANAKRQKASKAQKIASGLGIGASILGALPMILPFFSDPEKKDIGEPLDSDAALDVVTKTPQGSVVVPQSAIGYLAGAIQALDKRIAHLQRRAR